MRLIRESVRDLRAQRGRSILTVISLMVAVLSIVAIYTVGAIVRDVFVASAEQLNGRAVTVQARVDFGVVSTGRLTGIVGSLDNRVTASGGSYALIYETQAVMNAGTATGTPGQPETISLVTGRLDLIRRLPLLSGHWFDPDKAIYPGGLVANQAAARAYGGLGSTLSERLSSATPAYQQPIVGVIADGDTRPRFYQSLTSALDYEPAILSGNQLPDLFVHYPAASEAAIREKISEVTNDLGIDPSKVDSHRSDTIGQLLGNLRSTQLAFLGISLVTLAVAVLGLLNIGLATIRERARELTIRRAIGATRARVMMLVLLSTITLGLMSAVIAIGLAYGGVELVVPRLLNPASALRTPAFPWTAGLAGLCAAALACLIGGAAPAVAAARVEIVHVLRE